MPKKPSAAGKTLPKKPKQQANGAPSPTTTPPPAYFLSLTVENVRCFGPKQTLDLSDGNGRPARWTIILGENGTGKTTLLQCLAGMEPTVDEAWFQGQIGAARLPKIYFDKVGISRDDFCRNEKGKVLFQHGLSLGAKLNAPLPGRKAKIEVFRAEDDNDWYCRLEPLLSFDEAAELQCYGYGASRRMRERSPLTEEEADLSNHTSLFNNDVGLLNAEEWFLERKLTASLANTPIKEKIEDQINLVFELLQAILPKNEIKKIYISEITDEKARARLIFQTGYGPIHVRKLGFGYRTMIAWTVDLARRLFERYPESDDPLSEPAIVLIDEIDLHLHPSWQRQLIHYLNARFINTQFIVTAHGPLIVQAAVSANANIAVLQQEGDHVVIDQSPPAIRGWRVDQILSSDLFGGISPRGPELDTLLAERKKILSKRRLTQADKKRLEEIRTQYEQLPTGETAEDIKAMDIIHRAAKLLAEGGLASRD